MRRLGRFLLLLAAVTVAGAGPASAEFTENTIGCEGSAVITGSDGETTAVDAEDAEVTVPGDGEAAWEGTIQTVTHDHFGEINLEVGPAAVELGSWESENEDDESTRSGTKELESALGDVPPGKYDVTGFHQGDEGRCAGHVTVNIAGSIVSNPISAASLAIAVLALVAFVFGIVRGRPILAAFAGLLLGAFGALDLVFAGVVGSGSILLVVLPIALLLVGAVLAMMRLRAGRTVVPGGPPAPPPVPV